MSTEKHKNKNIKWLIIVMAIFLVMIIIPITIYYAYEYKYKNKIYHGVFLGNLPLAGLNIEQAKQATNAYIDKISQKGIPFRYLEQETVLYPLIASLEGDIAKEIIIFDVENTVNNIYTFARKNTLWENIQQKLYAYTRDMHFPISFSLNEKELNVFYDSNFSHFSTPAQNAELTYTKTTYNTYDYSVTEETYGQTLDYQTATQQLKYNLSFLDNRTIDFTATLDYPNLLKKDALNIDTKAQKIITLAPLTLTHNYNYWTIYKGALADWLALKPNVNTASGDKIIVGLNQKVVANYLRDTIAVKVNKEPIDAKFEIKDGKVVEFQISQDGIELDIDASITKIESDMLSSSTKKHTLIVREIKSELTSEDVNEFGVKEKLGVGHSSFAGSPKNRRYNIGLGAASVNGTLIAPDEEFSLLKVLGEVNKEAGYLPELVIKEGKTTPEYGGGLCQIGTTMFRSTINSGLPVTQRRNHSFRVSYYEPAGTDATIYDPWPDYRFLNDTGNHILVQSRIDGDDLYFEIWGTRDGRIATQTKPVVYNIVRPPPTKTIETLDLEPGQKKCTEHAVNGADAYFDYSITYTDGNIDETRFKSHYVPWREVCLIGVEKLSTSTEKILKQ